MQGYSKPEKHKTKMLTHTTSTLQECGLAKKTAVGILAKILGILDTELKLFKSYLLYHI